MWHEASRHFISHLRQPPLPLHLPPLHPRQPLKKSLFPVQLVAQIMASRAAATKIFFRSYFFGNFLFVENEKKRSQSALIDSPGRWTGNHIFSKGGLTTWCGRRPGQGMGPEVTEIITRPHTPLGTIQRG